MPFDNIVSRSDAQALIPQEDAREIVKAATQESAAMRLFRRQQMSTQMMRQPVMSALPISYWLQGDTGLKQTTEANWAEAWLTAEELASILPVPEAVIADANVNLFEELRPALGESVAEKVDAACFAGVDKPASWPDAIVPHAEAIGQVREVRATQSEGGVTGDLDALLGLVEAAGHNVTALVAQPALKALLRQARSTTGERLADVGPDSYFGVPIVYAIPATLGDAVAVAGDFNLAILGVRQDLTFKLLDQAILTNQQGGIVYNLPQQDMIALRLTARFALQVAQPVNRITRERSYPFAVLKLPDSGNGGTQAQATATTPAEPAPTKT